MKNLLLYLWQLPQNLAGLIVLLVNHNNWTCHATFTPSENGKMLITPEYFMVDHLADAGVSLGKYIIFDSCCIVRPIDYEHEKGHQKQSLYLGWLYLIVIGIPSGIHNLISRKNKCSYYHFWNEAWADKLGGVKRHTNDK